MQRSSYFKGYRQATPLTLLMPRTKNATPGTRKHACQVGNIYVARMNSLVACSISTQVGIRDNDMKMPEFGSRVASSSGLLLKTDTYALLGTQDFNVKLERKSIYRYIHCHYGTIYTEPNESQ